MGTTPPFPFMAFPLKYSVLYLQMCGINKDNLGYLSRRLSAVYLAFVPIPYQFR
jgi:hypothetical protein